MDKVIYKEIFEEMSYEMMKNILSFNESPKTAIPKLLEEIRELTGAKLVIVYKCSEGFSSYDEHKHTMLGVNPVRKKDLLETDIYTEFFKIIHDKKKVVVVSDEKNINLYNKLLNKGLGLSLLQPIFFDNILIGSFLILGMPSKYNLSLIIQGLEKLSALFALTFKGSVFYMDMEEMVEERTKSLLESEAKYRNILQTTIDGFWVLDSLGRLVDVNESYIKMSGYSREELLNLNISDLEYIEDKDEVKKHIERVILNKHDKFETIHKRKDGSKFNAEVSVSYIDTILGGKFIAFIRDITDRKLAEKELLDSQTRFKALHNASFGGITIHDKGVILECNAGLSEITGYSLDELIGMNGLLLISEETRDIVIKNINSGNEKPYEVIGLRKNGDKYPLRLEARNIPYKGKQVRVVEFRDITELKESEKERKNLELQLQQSQKLEAIGTLTGGIAHDFNNILTPILGYAELMKYSLNKESMFYNEVNEIISASKRAKELINQLLTFSRKRKSQYSSVNVIPAIKESLKFIRSSLPASIDIHQHISSSDVFIYGNVTQLHQIIMNLFINSAHAMEKRKSFLQNNTIVFTLNEEILDESDCKNFVDIVPGKYLKISISDNGEGMSEETLSHIFEPFYTTKEEGKGSGMGLAVVHGIIKSYHGAIKVFSDLGKGTTTLIYLPVYDGLQEKKIKIDEGKIFKGDERIFLLDDREYITNLLSKVLSENGYKIKISNDSIDACKKLMNEYAKYDVIITDQTMPQLTGIDLAKKLRKQNINLPIILLTGHSYIIDQKDIREANIYKVLQKPISLSELTKVIQSINPI